MKTTSRAVNLTVGELYDRLDPHQPLFVSSRTEHVVAPVVDHNCLCLRP
jgi:hypothetical protein